MTDEDYIEYRAQIAREEARYEIEHYIKPYDRVIQDTLFDNITEESWAEVRKEMERTINWPGKKPILDACCGGRSFYYEKEDPRVLFCDIREEDAVICDGRHLVVKPDMLVDFRNMPFPDESFHLVVFDPPHLTDAGPESWLAKRYGCLPKDGWQEYVARGLKECWRVLKPDGTLIFKWSDIQVKLSEVLKAVPIKPLLGTRTQTKTIFLTFYKT